MDELLKILLSWQFIIFSMGLASITFVIRKIFEFAVLNNPKMPGNSRSLFWRSVLLPIAPVVNGAVIAYFAKGYPYPEGLASSEFGRVAFGLGAGLLSGLVYRVIIELLNSKISQGNIIPDTSSPSNIVQVSINKEPVVPNIPEDPAQNDQNNNL